MIAGIARRVPAPSRPSRAGPRSLTVCGGCRLRAVSTAASDSRAALSSVTYAFAGVVYLSLTNRSNAALTMLAANGPGFEFPPGTGFEPLPHGYEPSAPEAAEAALAAIDALNADCDVGAPREIVYAGLGEPLVRLETLRDVVQILATSHQVSAQRLNTNGLLEGGAAVADQAAQMLAAAGLNSACVQIQSGDATQHSELMAPHSGVGLADAMEFATQLLRVGVAVECSVVARPEVNLELAETLALHIGATFKARPYFP